TSGVPIEPTILFRWRKKRAISRHASARAAEREETLFTRRILPPLAPKAMASAGDEDILQRRLAQADRAHAAGKRLYDPRDPSMSIGDLQPHGFVDHSGHD